MRRIPLVLLCGLPLALAACGSVPVAPTTALAAAAPPFACQPSASGAGTAPAALTAVRTGGHPGYDRFVIQFADVAAGYQVTPQATASFVEDASGRPVTLRGSAGVLIRLSPASAFGTYAGPTDIVTGLPVLLEARQIGDFEGHTTWALGLSRPACMRVFTLSGPSRLVVDVSS
jgi:hypothetical protein